MSDITLKDFDDIKNTLALKYAQLKTLEKEVKFLKQLFMDNLAARDENEWSGKTDFATFKMQEGFRILYPGNSDLEKKKEFYSFMQGHDKPWYQQSITLNWNAVNAYANQEIDALAAQGKTWEPWPHCERSEELKFDMRARPGVIGKLSDPKLKAWGYSE